MESVVHDIFVDLWRNAASFDPSVASEATFVAMIARRRLIDRSRASDRRPQAASVPEITVVPPAELGTESAEAARVLAKLKPDERRALVMMAGHAIALEDVARVMEIDLETARENARRGLLRVREALGGVALTPGATSERLIALLADRALIGLSQTEEEELARLLVDEPDREQLASEIEVAAAPVAVVAASARGMYPLPSAILARIEESAQDGMPTLGSRFAGAARPRAPRSAPKVEASAPVETATPLPPPAEKRSAPTIPPPPLAETSDVVKRTAQMPPHRDNAVKATAAPSQPLGAMAARQTVTAPPPPPPPPSHPRLAIATPAFAAPPPGRPPMRSAPAMNPRLPLLQASTGTPFRPVPAPAPARSLVLTVGGWLVAATLFAILVVIAVLYRRAEAANTEPVVTSALAPSASTPTAIIATPLSERDALFARPGSVKSDFTRGKDGRQATGDVVWNRAEQRGFLRLRGLTVNDRKKSVYQLFITDAARDEHFPVDAGCFDIDDETDFVVIPFKPKLNVTDATQFTVSIEKAGGVVVSQRTHVVLTATTK